MVVGFLVLPILKTRNLGNLLLNHGNFRFKFAHCSKINATNHNVCAHMLEHKFHKMETNKNNHL
jgi:hypothetical protein